MFKKKVFSTILCLSLLFSFSINAFGIDYYDLEDGNLVLVVDVIDSNALLVRTSENKQALIRILGISSSENVSAKSYAENLLEGEYVYVRQDSVYPTLINRWNHMHVFLNNGINTENSVAEILLQTGLVNVDNSTLTSQVKNSYTTSQTEAEEAGFGIWKNDDYYYQGTGSFVVSEYAVNINTATSSEIIAMLKTVFDDEYNDYTYVASSIIDYRTENTFNRIDELKFVDKMIKDDYDELKNCFTMTTNIKSAYLTEIDSLSNISSSEAEKIQDYFSENSGATFEDLYEDEIISKSQYESNLPFISTTDSSQKLVPEPNFVVNVNTASREQLEDAGVSSSISNKIIDLREDYGFTFKNVTEIYKNSKISMDFDYINELEDNLSFVTNINTATKAEIESLFGDDYSSSSVSNIIDNRPFDSLSELKNIISSEEFSEIENHIKINENKIEYFNINTVTKSELEDLGVSSTAINWIMKNQGYIDSMSDLDDEVLTYDDMFTLYTNVNQATQEEILSLNSEISTSLANEIVNTAKNEMYADIDEIEELFDDYDLLEVFDEVSEFIVFR